MIGNKSYWGNGIATEAVGLVTNWALNRINLHKVESEALEGHVGSIRVLEKNGFKQYGIVPQNYFLEGKYLATHKFYKLQEWA